MMLIIQPISMYVSPFSSNGSNGGNAVVTHVSWISGHNNYIGLGGGGGGISEAVPIQDADFIYYCLLKKLSMVTDMSLYK